MRNVSPTDTFDAMGDAVPANASIGGRADGSGYLRAGSVYVASTLYFMAWGSVLTFVGRTPLQWSAPQTWICVALTLAALIGLSILITGTARGTNVRGGRFRRFVLLYVGVCVLGAIVCTAVGRTVSVQLPWLATLILICAAFAAAIVSTSWGVLGVLGGVAGSYLITGSVAAVWLFVSVLVANVVYVRLALWIFTLMRQLDTARKTIASMSVERERLRFARDLHDVVGRSLSSIALKSELALRTDIDTATKDAHIRDTRDIAHRTLTDMRSLVRGYREIDLGSELDDALMVLRSASVFVEADGDAGAELDHDSARVAAWVIRESITNVLKHAPDATECTIRIEGDTVEIVNDGVSEREFTPPEHTDGNGSGLIGLRERVAAVGGTLEAGRDGSSFRLRCRLPGATTSSNGRRGSTSVKTVR